jgi:rhodanese-related sulfurtransferase
MLHRSVRRLCGCHPAHVGLLERVLDEVRHDLVACGLRSSLDPDQQRLRLAVRGDRNPEGRGGQPADVLATGKTTGTEILQARIASVLADGYSKTAIDKATLFLDLSKYYIVNYWPAAEYTGIGHIPGSIQYTPKADLKLATFLKTLPTDKTIVIYCYTGQTSANVAAILRVMGYDAKTLGLGTNGMIWQKMKDAGKTAFNAASDVMNFPYVK